MRRLIACADGTWITPDHMDRGVPAPTNVVKLARAVLPQSSDGVTQIILYSRGVGTDNNLLDRITGGAFGAGLSQNVRELYSFLAANYVDGDEIYLFGFSRGAYTVRSTAGMIRTVGLVAKRYVDKDLQAWQIYRKREGTADSDEARDFRQAFSRHPVRVRFMGVWDTVGALGIPGFLNFIGRRRFQFHDVALSRSVDHAYQALAIDERRRFFKPALWEQHPEATDQVMVQAWFPGAHMDVGGGYRDKRLSDAALLWMAQMARSTGLALDDEFLSAAASPDYTAPLHNSRAFPYTLIPAHSRPIGLGVPEDLAVYAGSSNEMLNGSALLKYHCTENYRPANVTEYIQRRLTDGA